MKTAEETERRPNGAALDAVSPFGALRASLRSRCFWYGATARWLPRSWRKKIRKRFARYRPGPFDVEVEGIRFRLYPAENHTDRTIFGRHELPEIPERELLEPHIQKGVRFVDIGGNIGLYSLFVAHKTENEAHIVSFEPHPRTFAKLAFNCEANRFTSIRCINSGVGPRDEKVILFSDGGGNIGGASMLPEASGDKVSTEVSIRPLGKMLREAGFDRVDVLKIDIEGFEDRALMPFLTDDSNKPLFPKMILIETVHRHLWEADLIGRLMTLGYRESGVTAENILFEHCA